MKGAITAHVRLYIVAEKRLATFVKDLIRARLVPSHLEPWWCSQHAVVMRPWPQAQGTRYSHQLADGTWCTGQATTTDATAPHHLQPGRSA
jgi:hypothetical protein